MVFDLSVILETGIPFCIPKQGKYGQFLVKKPLEPLFTLCRNQGIYGVAGSKASNNLVLGSFPLKKIPTPPPPHFFKEKPSNSWGRYSLLILPPKMKRKRNRLKRYQITTHIQLLQYCIRYTNKLRDSIICVFAWSECSNHMII